MDGSAVFSILVYFTDASTTKSMRWYLLLIALFGQLLWISCLTDQTVDWQENKIVSRKLDSELVLPLTEAAIRTSNNPGARHADSILSGLINAQFVSTGFWPFDLSGDGIHDISFDIIDLNQYNPGGLPDSFDTLAARVHPEHLLEILDNSTFGYPDALTEGAMIDSSHYWNDRYNFALGTFLNAGNFNGAGERYLGIRFIEPDGYHYGWVKLYVSKANDTLRIVSYGRHRELNEPIEAGQTSSVD